jgi:thiamine-phosphate diphosphorylase
MVPRLHLVTDDAVLARPAFTALACRLVERAASPVALHIRGHGTAARALFDMTAALVECARSTDALVLVNDRVDVARCAGAHGVQLGRRSLAVSSARALMGDRPIGFSAHSGEACAQAAGEGADFVLIGPVFATASHPGATPAGLGLVDAAVASVTIPVIAIGGITPETVAAVAAHGAHGVAVLGGVWNEREPERALTDYMDAVNGAAWRVREHAATSG